HGPVVLSDKRPASDLAAARAALAAELGEAQARVSWEAGGHQTATSLSAGRIVLSPGVPPLEAVEAARRAGVPVTGELELAAQLAQAAMRRAPGANGA